MPTPESVGFMCPECEEGLSPLGGKNKGYWKCKNIKCSHNKLYVEED
ncbi:hypothetical protein [Methanobacterium sp.]